MMCPKKTHHLFISNTLSVHCKQMMLFEETDHSFHGKRMVCFVFVEQSGLSNTPSVEQVWVRMCFYCKQKGDYRI